MSLSFDGVKSGSTAQLTVLTAPDAFSMNEVGKRDIVDRRVEKITAGENGVFEFELSDLSVAVLKTDS